MKEKSETFYTAGGGSFAFSERSVLPDMSAVYPWLRETTRNISDKPTPAKDGKDRSIRAYCRILLQRMRVPGSSDGISSDFLGLQDIMHPGLTTFNNLEFKGQVWENVIISYSEG
jgi:hypothetical protein